MADAMIVEILAPFRSEQRFAALRTGNDRPGLMKRTQGLGSVLHGHALSDVSSLSPTSPGPAAVISPICDGIVNLGVWEMKQWL
jgi:hypothetical protein